MVKQALLTALLVVSTASLARGELKPDELAIVAVRSSARSQEVAHYYARARGVPESHICLIDVAPHRNLSQQQWAAQVRPAIRRWLETNQLRDQVRCLVTTWDVPLKIESRGEDRRRIAFLKAERARRVQGVAQLVADFNAVAADAGADVPNDAGKSDEKNFGPAATVADLNRAVQQAIQAAEGRLTDSQADPQIKREVAKVGGLVGLAGGTNAATQLLARRLKAAQDDPKAIQQHALVLGRLAGLREVRSSLALLPESIERDVQFLEVIRKSDGLLATIAWIDEQLKYAGGNETYSSFDSELSLLWWPRYALVRWVPNPLHWRFDDNPSRDLRRTLMVARLEAPTVELTKKLVDAAIETEKQGLAGKVYLDARGLGGEEPEAKAGSYERYDQSLRRLQKLLAEHSDLEVVLDNKPELFQKGDCPQVALYCGWYSLAKYVDAFQWLPGSVGYHMASSEAVTLRGDQSQVWCKRMLDEGVAATLGPVYEPYLTAFPLPEEFFPVLTSGRYTLVETYYRTKPFNSWVMVLVGDPLYNPFRENRQFRGKLPEDLQKLLGPATELSDQPPSKWEGAIRKFEEQDTKNPPAKGGIVFVGSSSIRGWKLDKHFPDAGALNRGFGGSQMADSVEFVDRLVTKHEPRVVVVYAGDNDIAAGKSPETVLDDYRQFVAAVHKKLPKARIVYVAIKPSLQRWKLIEKIRQANGLIQAAAKKDERLVFVDIDRPMIGSDGKPRADLLQDDGLHLSETGYKLWSDLVRPHLKAD